MASDQQIRTTITAGRNARKSPADFDQGPIMIILLSCLAVAMCFTTLGMGFVNLARSKVAAMTLGASIKPTTAVPEKPSALTKISLPVSKSEPQKLQQTTARDQTDNPAQQEQEIQAKLESNQQAIALEQSKAAENAQRMKDLRAAEAQLSARIAILRSGISKNAAEELTQLGLRSQLEQESKDLQQRISAIDRRIEELKRLVAGAQRVAITNLLIRLGNSVWVECTRAGIVLLPKGDRVELTELQKGSERFLTAVANHRVQFLVRPDGFESFQVARTAAEQRGATSLGYEPIDASWRVKFQPEGARP